jgi:hypothetical protein
MPKCHQEHFCMWEELYFFSDCKHETKIKRRYLVIGNLSELKLVSFFLLILKFQLYINFSFAFL